jgi:hypothetical protein
MTRKPKNPSFLGLHERPLSVRIRRALETEGREHAKDQPTYHLPRRPTRSRGDCRSRIREQRYDDHPQRRHRLAHSCNGSLIATVTAGSFQIAIQATQTPSGAYHVIMEATAQGVQAATPSGTKYLIPGGFHSEQNVTPGATTSNYSAPLNVIGQGGAPNFTTRAVVHTTVTANGDVTASVDHFTSTGNCAV